MLYFGLLLLLVLHHNDQRKIIQRSTIENTERVSCFMLVKLPCWSAAFRSVKIRQERFLLLVPLCNALFLFRFWFFKILILVGICVGAFYIPRGDFGTGERKSFVHRQLLSYFWHVSQETYYINVSLSHVHLASFPESVGSPTSNR